MKSMAQLIVLLFFCSSVFAAQPGVLIDRQEMLQLVNDYLADQSRQLPNVQLKLVDASFPAAFEVPQGRIGHQLIPSRPGVIGSSRLTLMTRVDGQIVANQSIRVDLQALAEVVVASENLTRGELLDAGRVELVYQDISRLRGPIFSVEDVVGKRVKRSVRLGDVLEQQQVEFPPVVKRGERVTIQAHGRGLVLTAVGEAKQDGRIGESIRVLNSGSRNEVLCQVVAPGQVQVEF